MASLVAQMVKNLPAMQLTQAWSLDWEGTLEKEMATHSSILAWRILWAEGYSPWDWKELDLIEKLTLSLFFLICSEFCHTLKWNSHGFTCVPHPDPPSHLPLHLLPLGLPSTPGPRTCLMHPTWAGDLFHPR